MSSLALTLAIGDYDRTGALKTGAVRPQGVDLNILTLSPEEIFYRMGRFLEFDACEFSLSTYTIRRGRGEPMIHPGLPVADVPPLVDLHRRQGRHQIGRASCRERV